MALLLVIEIHTRQMLVAIHDLAAPHHICNRHLAPGRYHTGQDANDRREPLRNLRIHH
jgi:hypothetical protein